jgi:hypothetical protein
VSQPGLKREHVGPPKPWQHGLGTGHRLDVRLPASHDSAQRTQGGAPPGAPPRNPSAASDTDLVEVAGIRRVRMCPIPAASELWEPW